MTLREACDLYEKTAHVYLRPRTRSNRRSLLRQLCALLGDRPVGEITAADLEQYAALRLRTLRPVSVNSELRAFATLRNWLRRHGHETGVAPRPLRERPALRVRSWSARNLDALFEALDALSPGIVPLVYLLVHTGLRCGEALALRWDCVDLERRLIGVWPSAEWTTKSGKPREVPIGDDLAVLLRALPRRGLYVFPTRKGTRYRRWPQLAFDRARKAAGLKGGPHTLHHTYATEFLARGGSLSMLAQILGHSDERVTRIYAHLRPDHLAAARNLVRFAVRHRRG